MSRVTTLVQYTARPWAVALTGDGTLDLSTATGGHLLVHRHLPPVPPSTTPPAETVETWTASIAGGATSAALTLTVAMAGATPGANAVVTIGETLRLRPYLSFPGGPDVEFSQFGLVVLEA